MPPFTLIHWKYCLTSPRCVFFCQTGLMQYISYKPHVISLKLKTMFPDILIEFQRVYSKDSCRVFNLVLCYHRLYS